MKRLLMFTIAFIISVAFVATVFSQTTAPEATTEKPALTVEKPVAATDTKAEKIPDPAPLPLEKLPGS